VIHSFSVPVFHLKQDAIPGRVVTGWFKPIATGEHDIQCAEICGFGHALMPGRVLIETPEAHAAWITSQSPSGAGE
jgi:cytochrome c oxidase subunit 2